MLIVLYNEDSIYLYLFVETTENIKIMKKTDLPFGVIIFSHNFARYSRLTLIILIFLLPSCILNDQETHLSASSCEVMCTLCNVVIFFYKPKSKEEKKIFFWLCSSVQQENFSLGLIGQEHIFPFTSFAEVLFSNQQSKYILKGILNYLVITLK